MSDERATKQPGEWHIVHVLRRTLWHIDEGWDALAPRHQRRWFALMLGGLAALLGVTVALVLVGRALDARGLLAWAVLALLTAVVGFGRIRLGAHWPSDVVAGAIVGGFWLWMLVRALRKGEEGRRTP